MCAPISRDCARELEGRPLGDGIAAIVRDAGSRAGLRANFVVEGSLFRLPDAQANALLHMVREALSNVIKHAHATEVEVRLVYDRFAVTLSVTDNGRGFDPEAPRGEEHHGLRNLRSRAEEAGGRLTVVSAPGAGATVTAFIPIQR